MSGIVIGILAALGTLVLLRAVRRAVHRRLHRRGRSLFVRRLVRRLDATPEQERIFLDEAETLGLALRRFRAGFLGSRAELATLFEAEALDSTALDAHGSRQVAPLEALRRQAGAALARIHAALDARQRQVFADLIRAGAARGASSGP
ncbi:MAG TPA: hypothetical protein VMT17_12420 [Anaeromyxobacteraceae bacterium]|nr:hypothetical protein [Anaeromyxobacteraceae bacterium]